MTSRVLRGIARRRVTIGFVSSALALWLARPCALSLAGGATVAIAGEAIRVWAAGHLEKGREVTASGPYAFTRHPLYLGSTLIGIGVAIASASVVVAVLVIVYLAITLTAAVRTEEAHLTEKFGAAYPAYRQGRAENGRRRFSLSRAIRNREYRAVVGLVLVLLVLAWKARA
jgi:protein-S-isoprenylcysteine O-methyltransferase Ste14